MTGLVKKARKKLDDTRCLVSGRLRKDGCSVSMTDVAAPRLIIDLDRPGSPLGPNATRCDYLLIVDGKDGPGWVAPLELKRGRLHAGKVVRQLQAGAAAAESLIGSEDQTKFRPIAACGNAPKAERNELRKTINRIRLHGRTEAIRLVTCGDRLVQAFNL